MWGKKKKEQAQRRAATETAAFIWVFRYYDESSFHLENDFEINPASTQTWATHGAHLDNHMGQIWAYEIIIIIIWGPYGFCPPALYGSHVGCPLPIWVTDPAHSFHISCPQFHPYGPHKVFVHLLYMVPMWVAHCPYGSQILHTVSTYLAHSSTHMGPIQFLSTCFIWVPSGLPICSMGLMCGANMGPRSCPHFPQIMPIFLPLRAPYGFCPPVS